jgi:hypothetical protein
MKTARRLHDAMRYHCQLLVLAIAGFAGGCCSPRHTWIDTVAVKGNLDFQRQITNALALLKAKVPAAYITVTNQIGIIQHAKHSGMKASTRPPTFDLADRTAFYSLTWCAASIAHDSVHSLLYHDYLRNYPKARRVPDEVWKGEAAEIRCSEHQMRVLTEINAPIHEVNWCRQTNKYWEVKYRDRFW